MTPTNPLSVQEFQEALPDKVKKSVNQQLIDSVNKALADPEMYETYRENLLSYGKVMSDGRFKIDQYINAIKYTSHKLMGRTNTDAYSRTFPEKIQRFMAANLNSKDIASYVTAYNKSKLVNLVMEQTLVPFWVLNQDIRQKALNVQADLMHSARSEKVRSDAANSVLTHLKQPDTHKIELDVDVKEGSVIDQLRQTTLELVAAQRKGLEAGATTAKEVAESKIIDATAERIE